MTQPTSPSHLLSTVLLTGVLVFFCIPNSKIAVQIGQHQEVYSGRISSAVSKPSPSLPPPTAPVYSSQQVHEKIKQVGLASHVLNHDFLSSSSKVVSHPTRIFRPGNTNFFMDVIRLQTLPMWIRRVFCPSYNQSWEVKLFISIKLSSLFKFIFNLFKPFYRIFVLFLSFPFDFTVVSPIKEL